MRIVVATLGSRGDVQPMLALGEALHARGHALTFCGPSDARRMVETRGLAFVDLGVDAQKFLNEHPDVVGGGARGLFKTRAIVRELMDSQFRVLEPLAADADLMIGAALVSAPSSIAEAAGIPYRFVAFGSMAIPSRLHPPYLFPLMRMPGAVNLAMWRIADVAIDLFIGDALNQHRRRLGLRPTRRPSRVLTAPGTLLLAADAELSPPPLDYDPNIVVTGALIRSGRDVAPLPPDIAAFVAAGPPPVYVGFGSMTDTDPARTTRILADAARRAGVRLLVSSGWARLGEALPETCMAVGEVSHAALFPHLAGVVHHGGAGTTATAARAGVPQLIVPHMLDQFYWAGRIAALGIGPPSLSRRSLDAQGLAARLAALAADARVRVAASALADQLRSRDGVTAAVHALERVPPLR